MSDKLERPILKEDHDNLPRETYAGLTYPTHRYADFIPVADDKDQFALRQSIADVGLLDEIVLYQGAILDGRHRYAACTKLGIEPRFRNFEGDDEAALQFVLAKNIARRQLSVVQKLTLREKLMPEIERLRAAAKQNLSQGLIPGSKAVDTTQEVADMLGLGRATVQRAEAVQKIAEARPEAQEFLNEMLAGNIGVKTAYEKAKAVDVSAELDKEAKASAAPSQDKLRTTLIANIGKARDLLVGYDPSLLDGVYVDALDELEQWVTDAYGRSL